MKRIIFLIVFNVAVLTMLFLTGCEKQGMKESASATTGAGGSLARFAIVDNYLYIVDAHMLNIYDITDPSKPVS